MSISNLKESFCNGQLAKADYIVRMHDRHKVLFEYAEFIKTTDIKQIEIMDGQVVMTSRKDGIRMVCDPSDRRIAPIEILNFDEYEKDESEMIVRLVADGMTVFDIGGNFGWMSLKIAASRNASIFTFEPIPRTFGYLSQNVALNGIDTIRPFNFGFSDEEKDLTFYYYPEGSGNASSANLSEMNDVRTVTCKVRRMDDFVREQGVTVDFIKCDVEGAELFVFRGGLETIRRDKPIIFAELLRKWAVKFNYHPDEVVRLLADMGYRCFIVGGDKLVEIPGIDDQMQETNFFFLHTEKHAMQIETLC